MGGKWNLHPPKEAACLGCEHTFIAKWKSKRQAYADHCSQICWNKRGKTGTTHICLQCKEEFILGPSVLKQREKPGCCSKKCQDLYYRKDKHLNFKTGIQYAPNGEKYVLYEREGYVAHYEAERRVVAATEIGRPLKRGEVVIRINNQLNDNRPENLFICKTMSEYCKIRNGSSQWPRVSNLDTYLLEQKKG